MKPDNRYEHVKALIVDHNNSMRQILSSMLRAMGIKVIYTGTTEQQFRDLLVQEPVTLILCGWHPQKLDALSLLEFVRSKERTAQIPFMLVTDVIDQDLVKKAVMHGVSEYIVPPFNKLMLETRMSRALKMPIRSSATKVTQRINARRFVEKKKLSDINILVVDDVPDNIEVISSTLKQDYRVRATTTAKSAMEICLSESPPDLILLDIMMPEVDGLTLCKHLKRNAMTQNIVVIFLTALSEVDDIVRGLELGAVDYITKPVIPPILLARVNTHSQLILNQRAVQTQIDKMIEQQEAIEKMDVLIQKEMKNSVKFGAPHIEALESYIKPGTGPFASLKRVKHSWSALSLFTNNLRTIFQLENGVYNCNFCQRDISSMIGFMLELFEVPAEDRNVEMRENIDFKCKAKTDENLAILLLASLLRNAMEAVPRGGRVMVEVKNKEDFVLISINNPGEIPSEVRNTFFDVHVSTKGEEGSGLGVYFCFMAIKELQGELYYHSSEKYGTTFYIKLPKR